MTLGRRSTVDPPAVSAVVLAGGQSARLGSDKSFLLVDGQPLIARTVRTLKGLSDDLIVVANDRDRYAGLKLGARVVPDEKPGVGALMGLYSGLKAAKHQHILVLACDMPFVSVPLLRYMLPLAATYDAVVPRLGDLVEPLHAIYSKQCLAPMADLLERGQRRIVAFFGDVSVRYVEEGEIDQFDPGHVSFLNVNTVADWERLLGRLEEQRSSSGVG